MEKTKMTFALYFGNRGFFPGEVIKDARREMVEAVEKQGYTALIMDENKTRFGAVETIEEGKIYAEFIKSHKDEIDGIILCLPNFGDENGAYYALKDANVPILVQAYPDEIGKMDFANRRDSLCGKIAMLNVLRQAGIKYTQTKKFVVSPSSQDFANDLVNFAGICRVVKGFKSFTIGAIGARTTAFKTVRIDEIALQKKRINIESIDLSMVFAIMDSLSKDDIKEKITYYKSLSDFGSYPDIKVENIARLGVAIDKLIKDYSLDAIAIRCWDELQKRYGVAPCLILGDLNEKGIYAACELDISNAIMMRAVGLAADYPVMLLDVNNNYGDAVDKAIFFHCGPVPKSLMDGKTHIEEHLMFKKTYGEGSGVGLSVGKIATNKVTVASLKTENGEIHSFVTEGEIVDEPIEKAFFGCGMVFKKDDGDANKMMIYMGENGYRHHVAITKGEWKDAIHEAFTKYLGLNIDVI
ncbi:MAG: hypothetical protein IKA54_06040 [Clostridia bacterium]|nr:hypothetical protein [Clostridia bacterium]